MPVRGQSRQPQSGVLQLPAELVVELIPVPVPLGDVGSAVGGPGQSALRQHAGVLAQPHGAALGGDAHLIRHQSDHRMGGQAGELRAVGVGTRPRAGHIR